MTMKTRKRIKKPNFIISYCQCLAVVAAFLALAGLLIYGSKASEYGSTAMRLSSTSVAAVNGNITLALNKEKVTSQDIAKLKQQLLWHYSATGQLFEVYYNQKMVADSSRTMIMHYSPETSDGDSQPYFLELADPKYLQYFDTPEVLKYKAVVPVIDYIDGPVLSPKYDEQPVIEIAVREGYINYETGKFIPVSVYVYDTQDNQSLNTAKVTVNIPVDKNSPELKGYEYIKVTGTDRDGYGGSIEGYEGAAPDYSGQGVAINDYGVNFGYKSTDIKVIPFDEAYKTQVTVFNWILVVAILALSLIPASFLYNRRKSNYEIFEYRRKTTDAMAHDLKTPMAAILTYAENLENHTGGDQQEYYVSKISEKVWQMNKMVNSMLDFSRGENADVKVSRFPVDIGAVISDAVAENEHEISKRNLKVNYAKSEVTVNTDKALFAQAIGNLINNAALYSKEDSAIDITCDKSSIVITNVSAETIENAEDLKKPFAKGSESRKNMGTGLGLAIAENNLVLLGYKLDVKSEGGNFVVTVTL